MSGTTDHVRRLISLCVLGAAFALTGAIAVPDACAGQGKKLDPPKLLWNSYPLQRRTSTTEQGGAQIRRREASRQVSAHQDEFFSPLLVSAFILLLVSAAVVLLRKSLPIRVGTALRMADRARMPRPARLASVRRSLRRSQRPPHLREVVPEVVGEPPAAQPQSSPPRSEADLLEALQPKPPNLSEPEPKPPSVSEPEPTPDVPITDLEQVRLARMPESVEQRPAAQPKLREAGDFLVEEREPEPEPYEERELGLELRTWLGDLDVVPVPEPSPETHQESQEVCEIMLWRGYKKCRLFATLAGSNEAIAVSSYFRLRDEDSPGDEARLALRDLIATLERFGWTVVSHGPAWYEDQLERLAEDPDSAA